MPEGLMLNIGADVTGAVIGLKEVNVALLDLAKKGKLSLQQVEAEMVKFQALLKTTTNPAAISNLNGALKTLGGRAEELKKVGVEITKVGTTAKTSFASIGASATKALSGLRTLAAIIPGVGIGGIFALAATGVKLLIDELSKVNKVQKVFNDSVIQATKSTGDEIVKIQAYVAIAKDENQTRQVRLNAVAALNKQYPDTLRNLTLETINTEAATAAIDKLTSSLYQKALAEALANKVAERQADQAEILLKMNDALQNSIDLKSVDAIKQLRAQFNLLFREGDTAEHLVKKYDALGKEIIFLKDAAQSAFAKGLEVIPTPKAIKPPNTDAFKKMRADLLREALFSPIKLIVDEDGALRRVRETIEKVEKGPLAEPLKIPVELDNSKLLAFDLEKFFKVEQLKEDLGKALESAVENAFASIGEGIGKAIGEGDIGAIFTGLFQTIGAALKEFGAALIAYGVAMEAFKKTFSNPIAAIAAGIALIAAGALIQTKIPKLASGGIIPEGFPNDTFPALLSSGEAVIPLNRQLPGMGGGSLQTVRVIGDIRGDRIKLLNARTDRRQGRGF